MQKIFLTLLIVIFSPLHLFAVNIIRGPYVENVLQDRAVIRFRLDKATVAWLGYGAAPVCDRFLTVSRSESEEHQFILYGLLPDTTHCYQVFLPIDETTAVYKAAEHQFITLRGQNKPYCRFIAFGDSGSGSDAQYELAGLIEKKEADFVLHTGDVIESGLDSDADEQYFIPYKNMLVKMPFYIALGNHDYGKDYKSPNAIKFLRENFGNYHNMPITGKTPHYYYFDCGNARFIALDNNSFYKNMRTPSLIKNSSQYKWLNWILSRTRQMWKIVFFHIPMYSSGYHGSNIVLRETLEPLFSKYGVDVVFQGHDHNYERTKLLKDGKISETDGTIYITLGGGGRPLYFKRTENDWTEKFEAVYHFGYVEINDTKFSMTVYGIDGSVLDQFEIKK